MRGELNGHSHVPGVKLVHTEQALAHSSWFHACHLQVLIDLSSVDDGSPEV